MAILVSNRLDGTDGVQVTDATLAASADLGTVTIGAGGPRAVYNSTYTVRDLSMVRVETGHHRGDTPHLRADLPTTPWSLRWYIRLPDMQVEGHGVNETRWLARLGEYGLVASESSDGKILLYLQPDGLASERHTYDVASGTWPLLSQIHRVEASYDGTDVVVSLFAEHGETAMVTVTWQGFTLNATEVEVSAYRFRRGVLLQQGDSGSDVEARQGQLITLGYLSTGDDDGIYGPGTAGAVTSFQTDFGLDPVDGEIGPETGAALDLAEAEALGDSLPPPTYVSFLAAAEGEDIGPAPVYGVVDGVANTGFSTQATVADTTKGAEATAGFSTAAEVADTTKGGEATAAFSTDSEIELSVGVGQEETAGFDTESEITLAVDVDGRENAAGFEVTSEVTSVSLIPDPPPIPPQYRLAVYDPNGSVRGYLPHTLNWQASFPLNDTGAMNLTYIRGAAGAHLLEETPFEIALQIRRGSDFTYTEPPGARYISLRRKRDLTDRAQTFTWTLASYSWMFRKSRAIHHLSQNADTGDYEKKFTNATVGTVLNTLLNDSQSFDVLPGVSWNFTTLQDRAGLSWEGDSFDITYSSGTPLDTTLSSFTEQKVDWRMDQRELQVYNAGTTMQRDMADEVHLRHNSNLIEAPEDLTYEDLATRAHLQYEDGYATLGTGLGLQPWGVWEDLVTASGVDTSTDASSLLSDYIIKRRGPRQEFTRKILVVADLPVPMLDYLPGDYIAIDTWDPAGTGMHTEELRVTQVTLSAGTDRIMEATITVGDLFYPTEVSTRKRMRSVTNSVSYIGGAGSWRQR